MRFSGGSNAGHTVFLNQKKVVFHLLPSASFRAKRMFVGAGVVIDPEILKTEISLLSEVNRDSKVYVDRRCSIVSPFEKILDAKLEEMRGSRKLGTTLRGIGPSFGMRALRLILTVNQILNKTYDLEILQKFYDTFGINAKGLPDWIESVSDLFKNLAADVSFEIYSLLEKGENILFEGSQGTLLDILYGTYPFVTSTSTISGYIPASLGISPKYLDSVLGVAKCYNTRVGNGPFPTELIGEEAERIRNLGSEFGATTGRPRRVGWLDLPLLRYACRLNGATEIAITKVDVLSKIKEPRICIAYSVNGEEKKEYNANMDLDGVEPVFIQLDSFYNEDLSRGLPKGVKQLVETIEKETKVKVSAISYGPERDQTIEL